MAVKVIDATGTFNSVENQEGRKEELSPAEKVKQELDFSKSAAVADVQKNLNKAIDPEDVEIGALGTGKTLREVLSGAEKKTPEELVTGVSTKIEAALTGVADKLKTQSPQKITQNIYTLGGQKVVNRIMEVSDAGFASAEMGEVHLKYLEDSESIIMTQFKDERGKNEKILKQKEEAGTWLKDVNEKYLDVLPKWLQKTALIGGAAVGGAFVASSLGVGAVVGAGIGYAASKFRKRIEKHQIKRREADTETYLTLSDQLKSQLEDKLTTYKKNAENAKTKGEEGRNAAEMLIINRMGLADESPEDQAKMIDSLIKIQKGGMEDVDVHLFYPGATEQDKVHLFEAVKQIPWLTDRKRVKENLALAKAITESSRKTAEEQEKKLLAKLEGDEFNMKDFEEVKTIKAKRPGATSETSVFDGLEPLTTEVTQDKLRGSIQHDLTFESKKEGLKTAISTDKMSGLLGVAKSTELVYTLDYLFKNKDLLHLLSPTTKRELLTWLKSEDEKYQASEVAGEEGTHLQKEYWNKIEGKENGLLKEGKDIFSGMKADMLDENSVKSFDEKINTLPELERKHGSVLKNCMKPGVDITDVSKITVGNLSDDIVNALEDTGGKDELIKKLKSIKAIFDKVTELRTDWENWKKSKEDGKTFFQYQKEITDQGEEVKGAKGLYETAVRSKESKTEKEALTAFEAAKKALKELKEGRAKLIADLSGVTDKTKEIADFFSIDAPGIKFHKDLKLKAGVDTKVPFFKRIQSRLFKEFADETESKLLGNWEEHDPLAMITTLRKKAGAVKVDIIDNADDMGEVSFPSDFGKVKQKELNITSNTTNKVVEMENDDIRIQIISPCVARGGEENKLKVVRNAIVFKKDADGNFSKSHHAIISGITLKS
jgi:hypothetical protein